jgi:hypothetical protein
MIAFAVLLSTASASCAHLAVALNPSLRRAEARQIAMLSGQRVRASGVSYVLAERNWRLVFATPNDAERGVYVLRRSGSGYRLIDTWGGVLAPNERGEATTWARGLKGGGVPHRLAACMDAAILAGR